MNLLKAFVVSLVLVVSALVLPCAASAQTDQDIANLEAEFTREATHTIMGTTRIVHFPGFLLDIWFQKHANHWDGQANMAWGLEYTYRKTGSFDLQVGAFWTDLSMHDKYWLEADKSNWSAADYTKQSLSAISAEASIFGYHDFIPEFGVFYGGVIWFGGVLGEIQKSNIDALCADAAQAGNGTLASCPHEPEYAVEDGVPPVAGFVSISAGLRAEIEQRFIIKLEAGFKGYFFLGLSMGAQFW